MLSAVFKTVIIAVHFKKYFLVLLINAEKKKLIAIFDIIFYTYIYVDTYRIPDTVTFKHQSYMSDNLV